MPKLAPDFAAELRRIRDKLDSIEGPGVRHTKTKIYIGQPAQRRQAKQRRPREGVFKVDVEATEGQTAGTNGGNNTTAATWTYTVWELGADHANDDPLGEAKSPTWGRTNGKVGAATIGFAQYVDGEIELIQVNELPGTGGC